MAEATRTKQLPPGAIPWLSNISSADASGGVVVKAAGGSGVNHYITRVWLMGSNDDITLTLGSGDDIDAAIEVAIIGPIPQFDVMAFDFRDMPIVVEANKAILIDAGGAGDVAVVVEGATL